MSLYREELKNYFEQITKVAQSSITNWFNDFPEFAEQALTEMNTAPLKNPSVIAELITDHHWPAQHFRSGVFADLSFTLFRNEHFFLDLYIWNHQDTNIHDHHFSGAFQVVQGESFHISYDFTTQEKLSSWLKKGQLNVLEKTNLIAGDTRRISFNNEFIHQNLHTTNPCVTLCLRTNDHPEIMLNSYYNRGMKVALYRIDLKDMKQLEAVCYLQQNSADSNLIPHLISTISDHALYSILTGQKGLIQTSTPQLYDTIHKELQVRNPDQFSWFMDVIEKQNKLSLQLQSMFKVQA